MVKNFADNINYTKKTYITHDNSNQIFDSLTLHKYVHALNRVDDATKMVSKVTWIGPTPTLNSKQPNIKRDAR